MNPSLRSGNAPSLRDIGYVPRSHTPIPARSHGTSADRPPPVWLGPTLGSWVLPLLGSDCACSCTLGRATWPETSPTALRLRFCVGNGPCGGRRARWSGAASGLTTRPSGCTGPRIRCRPSSVHRVSPLSLTGDPIPAQYLLIFLLFRAVAALVRSLRAPSLGDLCLALPRRPDPSCG